MSVSASPLEDDIKIVMSAFSEIASAWVPEAAFSEMARYGRLLTLSGHFYSPAPLTMSLRKFNKLSEAHQQVLLESAVKAAAFERKLIRDNESKQLAELKKSGMQVTEVDKKAFINVMKPIYDKFEKKNPSWKQIISQIQKNQ